MSDEGQRERLARKVATAMDASGYRQSARLARVAVDAVVADICCDGELTGRIALRDRIAALEAERDEAREHLRHADEVGKSIAAMLHAAQTERDRLRAFVSAIAALPCRYAGRCNSSQCLKHAAMRALARQPADKQEGDGNG